MKAVWLRRTAETIAADIRRISPEGAGVIVSLAVIIVFCTGVSLYTGHLARQANIARAVAAQETAEQLAAHEAVETAARAAQALAVETPPANPPGVAPPPAARAYPQMGKAFVDRFDGAELHDRWYVSDGWSNGAWMENDWQSSQVKVTPEGLRITLGKSAAGSETPFSSGEIQTQEKFRYGYFEIRMRTPHDPGMVIGAFTYAARDGSVRPNEIDIEITGRDTRRAELTYHQNSKATHEIVALPFDSAEGFHTYAFDWRPDAVRWYVDGALVHEETGDNVGKLNRPQQFLVSLWSSRQLKDWVGDLDASKAPWFLDVSCIAYAPEYAGKRLCAN
ncbi:MAG: family 16 glycosylhydrolase [Hyphomonadaceae bacterium]|nr:family 16 glycosylhydrolase [Hyphomonadaceae bacterium]